MPFVMLIGLLTLMIDAAHLVQPFILVLISFLGGPENNLWLPDLAPKQNIEALLMPLLSCFGFRHFSKSFMFTLLPL
jgi:hypothetical protein